MADFCNVCSPRVWGEVDSKGRGIIPDIDVFKIFKGLKKGYMLPVLCEGCTMNGIMKNENGELKVHYLADEPDVWHNFDEDEVIDHFEKSARGKK